MSPFYRRYASHVAYPVDQAAMAAAAAYFVGEHDFRGFCAAGTPTENFVREIFSCRVLDLGGGAGFALGGDGAAGARAAATGAGAKLSASTGLPAGASLAADWSTDSARLLAVEIRGSGFLWNMVRISAGTLLEVGAASQLELDTARVTLLSAQTSMASTLQQLEDNLQTLRDTMADADVKSTMDGMVSSLSVVVGATASPTSPAAVITERGSQVTVSVSEAVQPYLSIGDTAQVIISSASDEAIEATVRTISPSAGAMTQLFDVVLDLPEDTTLTAGMFATVLVETERRENVITVPTEAILNDGVSQSVYVVEDGLASQRVLTTGLVGDGVTEVVEGLTGGEQLVVVGQSYLADGAPVRIVEG